MRIFMLRVFLWLTYAHMVPTMQHSNVADYAVELFSLVLLLFGDVCSQGDHSLLHMDVWITSACAM